VSNEISVYDGYKIAAQLLKKSSQRKWNEENTGRFTYSLIPDVSTKVIFPRDHDNVAFLTAGCYFMTHYLMMTVIDLVLLKLECAVVERIIRL